MTPLQRATKMRIWGPNIEIERKAQSQTSRASSPEELVTLFSGEVWRFASAQVRNREDAEDILMEVFAVAFRDFGQLRRVDSQANWLLAVARRKVADTYRKSYRRAEQPLVDQDLTAFDEMPNANQMATRSALAGLPEGQREVITLKYINGLSTEEVGQVTRRSVAATNSLLQRGRQNLRDALGATFAFPDGRTEIGGLR